MSEGWWTRTVPVGTEFTTGSDRLRSSGDLITKRVRDELRPMVPLQQLSCAVFVDLINVETDTGPQRRNPSNRSGIY
jgi:hypothetical protein